MSRINNFIDRPTQEREAELDIMYDNPVTVQVWRSDIDDDDNPGVTEEVDGRTYLRSINVRLDEPARRSTPKFVYIALTDDTDVLVNDVWKWTPPRGSQIELVVKKVNYRPSGNEVEVGYGG